MSKDLTNKSKFLALILRHDPAKVGLNLDKNGWANVKELISKSDISKQELEEIVRTDNKGRYSFDETKTRIRANQGHSIAIEHDFKEVVPPAKLYHGTAYRVLDTIMREGISKMQRHHVHLSTTKTVAETVGARHGKAVVIEVNSFQMHRDGYKFYVSSNGVYLTDEVPPKYLRSLWSN